jgi:hypothetical protein
MMAAPFLIAILDCRQIRRATHETTETTAYSAHSRRRNTNQITLSVKGFD